MCDAKYPTYKKPRNTSLSLTKEKGMFENNLV
jgi:hypothetical protein